MTISRATARSLVELYNTREQFQKTKENLAKGMHEARISKFAQDLAEYHFSPVPALGGTEVFCKRLVLFLVETIESEMKLLDEQIKRLGGEL